jgi:hypothetical protein
MIEAKELMQGNWVDIPNGVDRFYIKVHSIYPSAIGTAMGTIMYREVQPIHLLPDILEKAGFVKVNHIHGYTFFSHEKSKISVYEHKTQYMGYGVFHAKYVHQLQNLYYSLTGTELTINL